MIKDIEVHYLQCTQAHKSVIKMQLNFKCKK